MKGPFHEVTKLSKINHQCTRSPGLPALKGDPTVCLVDLVKRVSMEIEDFQDFHDWIGLLDKKVIMK